MAKKPDLFAIKPPPFETEDLRRNLAAFLNHEISDSVTGGKRKVGNFRWGVYAFFDYDREPIYVGQTNESLRSRIGRHLTNKRTDAVAMSVLDPFEVYEIEVWPLPQFQKTDPKDKEAKALLDALEKLVYQHALEKSKFGAILNEKDPPRTDATVTMPSSYRAIVVSEKVHSLRSHPDTRIARRALTISRLAQVISERKVQGGLRRVLLTQAKRLEWLAERRYAALGGAASVEAEDDAETTDEEKNAEGVEIEKESDGDKG